MIVTVWLVVPGSLSSEKMIHYGWIGGLLGAWIGGGQWFIYWLTYRKNRIVVENNALGSVLAAVNAVKPGTTEKWQKEQQAAIKEACCGPPPYPARWLLRQWVPLCLRGYFRKLWWLREPSAQ